MVRADTWESLWELWSGWKVLWQLLVRCMLVTGGDKMQILSLIYSSFSFTCALLAGCACSQQEQNVFLLH